MNKKQKEVLDSMSIRELQNAIFEKQKEEAMKKYGSLRETEYKISEVEGIKAEEHNPLFHVVVEDGSEGWECIVEISEEVDDDWTGDREEVVEDLVVNFMIEEGYYKNGDIEDIRVNEICRYSRPILKIHK
jgi:hypothetical protein